MSCVICGRASGATYRLPAAHGGAPELRCLRHAVFAPSVRRKALKVSLTIGTALFLINQADVVLRGAITGLVLFKILLTYVVPYLVSTDSALGVSRVPNP